ISTTGIGGLTLGGGHGYLTRKFGLSIDNLVSAEVVIADGTIVEAAESRNEDLFWAIRGGGGNFGVVTSFSFRLHSVDTVLAGVTVWELERAGDVIRSYREFLPRTSEEVYAFLAIMNVPPAAPFPPELHGRSVAAITWCLLDPQGDVGPALEAFSAAGPPAFHFTAQLPYPALNSLFDPLLPPGMHCYKRGHFFDHISEQAIDVIMEHGSKLPTPLSWLMLYPVDGAAHKVGPDETAWSYRDAVWSGIVEGFEPEARNADRVEHWCRAFGDALQPHSMGAGYINFLMDGAPDRVRAAYRGNYERLADIKGRYDPGNVFRHNHNIKPRGGSNSTSE
ncbi:MAG: BBE domain-containing protein, partial [Actinomycetota bacterium]